MAPAGLLQLEVQTDPHRMQPPLQLADAQRSGTERELLAGYRSVLHFQHLLEGRHFTWFTDHRPLLGMMAKTTDPKSAMQADTWPSSRASRPTCAMSKASGTPSRTPSPESRSMPSPWESISRTSPRPNNETRNYRSFERQRQRYAGKTSTFKEPLCSATSRDVRPDRGYPPLTAAPSTSSYTA